MNMKTFMPKLANLFLTLTLLSGLNAMATTSTEDLDDLLFLRKSQTEMIAFLMQITKEGSVLRTTENIELLRFLSESQPARITHSDDLGISFMPSPYKFEIKDLTYCPEASDLSRLCFNEKATKAILNLSKLYINELIRTDYKYKSALNLVANSSLTSDQRAEISARAAALEKVNQAVADLKAKFGDAHVALVNSVTLLIATLALLAVCIGLVVTATIAGPGILGLIAFIAMLSTGVGTVGFAGYGLAKGISIEKQLVPLLKRQSQLTEHTLLDKDVLAIMNKSIDEKLAPKIKLTSP